MAEFKLIYGKKSIKYNHFKDYDLESCRATQTRLMGVAALKVTWRSREDRRSVLYQVIHLDYSEYGVDDYQEFLCAPGSEDYADKKSEMQSLWKQLTGVMGGEVITIDAPCMLKLIESALPLAGEDVKREYDSDENRQFRSYALLRLSYMKEALASAGISSESCSEEEAIEALSPSRLSAYETINYFIMRVIDRDFKAAACLSSLPESFISDLGIVDTYVQTLVRSDIEKSSRRKDPSRDGVSYPFRVRITTLGRNSYCHCTFIIWLNGNYRAKNPLVTELRVGSVIGLSDFEAALQISRPEYITVFGCHDSMLSGFDNNLLGPFARSTAQQTPNGWLYTAYKPNNSYVDSPAYRLGNDVYGYGLLTIAGEFVLMSHDLRNITMLDDTVIFSIYSPYIHAKGRYMLDTPVFQTLCRTPGIIFDELVEPDGD